MCGIFCIFSTSTDFKFLQEKCKVCEFYIKRRGPNYYSSKQGKELVEQPVINEKSIFIFNGDIFGGDISDEDRILYGDTVLLMERLENCNNVIETLTKFQGPYAFVYLDKNNLKLYFARDIFGRRCLLIGKTENGFVLTSIASKDIDCVELPAIGVFCYDLREETLTLLPWGTRNNNFLIKLNELNNFLNANTKIHETLDFIEPKGFTQPNDENLEIFQKIILNQKEAFTILLGNAIFLNNVQTLHFLLENAISKRISTQPRYCQNCILNKDACDHALIAVLFSGGLDCTILALLSDKFTDSHRSIDLINVAFEKGNNYDTPDRKTGLESFEELKKLRPNRKWKFVDINVTTSELDEERTKHIRHLIHPLNSILDDSLGCALWFASRARNEVYKAPARVLLVGMGADELFGGYTRHRAALKKNGWLGLHNSLNEDWQNISHRNLARDDRVVSDHGRQLRTPYLDEALVDFVRNLNCWEKTNPSHELSTGLGDKILLRTLAYYLGLQGASTFKKKALQFGSRIANRKENAHEVSPRL